MAILSLTLRDAYGRETSKQIEMVTQATLAEYNAAATAGIQALEAITDLAVVRADVILKNLLELLGTPAAGSNVDVGATFQGELETEDNRKASHKVPGIKAEFVGGDGTIDLTQTAIATYLAMFVDGADMELSNGEQISAWLRGVLDR